MSRVSVSMSIIIFFFKKNVRTIDLRHEGFKTDVEMIQLHEDLNSWTRLGRDLHHQLSVIHSGYTRKMVRNI
jgi:hypothetical protein